MLKTTKTMLVIASLLAATATAMAAPATPRWHRMDARAAARRPFDARAQVPTVYDPPANAFEPIFGGSGQILFERAKGNID